MKRWFIAVLWLLTAAFPVAADEFRPAYLQLRETEAGTYEVLWKLPALDESLIFNLAPQFPSGTIALTPVRSSYAAGAAVQRWRIRIDGGLPGKTIHFPGLASNPIGVLVRLERVDGSVQLGRAVQYESSFDVVPNSGKLEVVQTYTLLGIQHILTGFDHLLFVLSLVILVKGVKRLLATITAFTLAHSLTLVAATIGWIHVPGPPVEAGIAPSIVFVAGEIIHSGQGRPGLTERYPWLIAFTFGLLHGLGFASALSEVGLPQLSVPTALLFFNVGVEIGQLIFIVIVFVLAGLGRRIAVKLSLQNPPWIWRLPPYAIGSLASFWVVDRLLAF